MLVVGGLASGSKIAFSCGCRGTTMCGRAAMTIRRTPAWWAAGAGSPPTWTGSGSGVRATWSRPSTAWARHQPITDPVHLRAAEALRQQQFALMQPAAETRWNSASSSTMTPRWAWPDSTKGWHCDHENRRPGRDRRHRLSDSDVESRPACENRRPGSPSGRAAKPGRTRKTWRSACHARSPPDTGTAARTGSGLPGSRPAKASKSSTSTTPAA
jgi:hypothetical protein